MGRTYQILSFGQKDALVLWGQWPFWRILLVWEFCVMRCFGIVRTIPTSSSSWYTDQISDPVLCVLASSETTLLCIVSWLLQRSKDYSDTIVFEARSCEILSLCGDLIWRWNFVFRRCFVFRKTLYRRLWMNHFVLKNVFWSPKASDIRAVHQTRVLHVGVSLKLVPTVLE